jgi:ABC-type polysaccharide/polyol phosphate export permease
MASSGSSSLPIAVAGIKLWSFLSSSMSIITKSINDWLPAIFLVDSV